MVSYGRKFTVDELIEYLRDFNFSRDIKELHLHHTWKPVIYSFLKAKNLYDNPHIVLQDSMRNYHKNVKGWSDIGQTFTLFPDGIYLYGRDINTAPASIKNRNSIGFAVEMIGNFDDIGEGDYNNLGYDKLEGEQKEAIVKLCNFVLFEFGWNIVFHNEYSDKTCPSIDKTEFMNEVKNYKKNIDIDFLGKEMMLDTFGVENGISKVGIRELFEKLNLNVDWDSERQCVVVSLK